MAVQWGDSETLDAAHVTLTRREVGNPDAVVATSKLLRERLEYPFEGFPFLRLVEFQRQESQERCREDCDEKSETRVSCQEGSCCPSSSDSR